LDAKRLQRKFKRRFVSPPDVGKEVVQFEITNPKMLESSGLLSGEENRCFKRSSSKRGRTKQFHSGDVVKSPNFTKAKLLKLAIQSECGKRSVLTI